MVHHHPPHWNFVAVVVLVVEVLVVVLVVVLDFYLRPHWHLLSVIPEQLAIAQVRRASRANPQVTFSKKVTHLLRWFLGWKANNHNWFANIPYRRLEVRRLREAPRRSTIGDARAEVGRWSWFHPPIRARPSRPVSKLRSLSRRRLLTKSEHNWKCAPLVPTT